MPDSGGVFKEASMRIYDISMSIAKDMPVYKGREAKKPVFKTDSDFKSSSVYETRLEMNLHTGTHIDAPLHILEGGKQIDQLELERVVRKCKVFDFQEVEDRITKEHLAGKDIDEGDFIILKTKNSFLDILEKDYIFLDKSGAKYLESKKVNGVGIDALGIERSQPEHETHKILLGAEIVILEGLCLSEIEEGEYFLFAAPIKIANVEAAPVRAILIK
jgi:arylformamidase